MHTFTTAVLNEDVVYTLKGFQKHGMPDDIRITIVEVHFIATLQIPEWLMTI